MASKAGKRENNLDTRDDNRRPRITRVDISNFKSVKALSVDLADLTVIVGRNGAGKSNFLDSLRFVAESLNSTLGHALQARGGIKEVRRRAKKNRPHNFGIGIKISLSNGGVATYQFEVAAQEKGGYVVKSEILVVTDKAKKKVAGFEVSKGTVRHEFGNGKETKATTEANKVASDRLYLVRASDSPPIREVYDTLKSVRICNLSPLEMKKLQPPDAGGLLDEKGSNIASVVKRLKADFRDDFDRVMEHLQAIVPSIIDVTHASLGPNETLKFTERNSESDKPTDFIASNMSDGTLRALGALVSVAQLTTRAAAATLIGIEEPETALHPAASGALVGALREASRRTQVVLTCHSPDLLDQLDIQTDRLLVAKSEGGVTKIGRVDEASRKTINEHLFSPGDLLRMDQLEPSAQDLAKQENQKIFDWGDDESQP